MKAIIIGSGFGALATALRLTHHGYEVEIIEKYHQAGGRVNQIMKDGFSFDIGPSFFTMSFEFKELFDYCKIPNPLRLCELDPLYAVYFEGREKPFLIHKNLELLQKEFAGIENNFLAKAKKYLTACKELSEATENTIVKQNFDNLFWYALALMQMPLKHAPKVFRNYWRELERNFDSEEVKIIFSLVAFFLGSTPFQTPAIYTLLNYTELKHDGYWNLEGGMYTMVEEVVKILKVRGVAFHFGKEVSSVVNRESSVVGVKDENGKEYFADIFICNSDAAAFRGKVLQRKKFTEQRLDKMKWTFSPFCVYLGVKGKCEKLHHHNYFLGNNFKEYTYNVFESAEAPYKPSYYVNVSSKSNSNCAPEGCENIFILCPVPDLRFKKDWNNADDFANTLINDLAYRIDFDLQSNTLSKTIYTPYDWQNNFNLYRGSGLGLQHGLNQIGYFRPKNKDEVFNNFYYVGASTTPGTGVPLTIISSKLVMERILKEHPMAHG